MTMAFLGDQPWLPALVALFGALLVTRQIKAIRRRNEFDVLEKARERLATAFEVDGESWKEVERRYYDLRHRFRPDLENPSVAAGETWGQAGHRAGLQARIRSVRQLSKAQRDKDLAVLRPVVEALNDVAAMLDGRFVDPHKLLATHHLRFIREVFIAEPYIVHEALFSTSGRWGLRVVLLGDVARSYNDINPLHRQDVYMRLPNGELDLDYGVIHPMPRASPGRLIVWRIRAGFSWYSTITERGKRRQKRRLELLRASLASPDRPV